MKSDKSEFEIKSYLFGNYHSSIAISSDLLPFWRIDPGFADRTCLLVADEYTARLAPRYFGTASPMPPMVCIPQGEVAKNWLTIEKIIAAARKAGLSRDGLIIGIGGGVVTDLAAFAASIYMRGIALWLAPTTILAMVDAALGGKTGIDLFNLKNLVGSFRPADYIVIDSSVSSSLPRRECLSGLAELIKTAIIGDDQLLSLLARQAESVRNQTATGSESLIPSHDMIAKAIAVKAAIVESDPEERNGRRALLNLGHSYGHALETVAGLGVLSHGEAVAWGIARAVSLSRKLGIIGDSRADLIIDLLAAFGYCVEAVHPACLIKGDREAARQMLLSAMAGDKKRSASSWRFVLPNDDSVILSDVDSGLVAETL